MDIKRIKDPLKKNIKQSVVESGDVHIQTDVVADGIYLDAAGNIMYGTKTSADLPAISTSLVEVSSYEIGSRPEIKAMPNGNLVAVFGDDTNSVGKFKIYDSEGNIELAETTYDDTGSPTQASVQPLANNNLFLISANNTYCIYSPTGALIKALTAVPDVAVNGVQTALLSNGNIVAVFKDVDNGSQGTFIIFDSDGEVVKSATVFDADAYGGKYVVTALESGGFVTATQDSGTGFYFWKYDNAGTNTLAKQTLLGDIQCHAIASMGDKFALIYNDYNVNIGKFIIYDESGTGGTPVVFEPSGDALATTVCSHPNGEDVSIVYYCDTPTMAIKALQIDSSGNMSDLTEVVAAADTGYYPGIAPISNNGAMIVHQDANNNLRTSTITFKAAAKHTFDSDVYFGGKSYFEGGSTLDDAVDLNTTHRTSTGEDHTYINQDVSSTGNPVFNKVYSPSSPTLGVTTSLSYNIARAFALNNGNFMYITDTATDNYAYYSILSKKGEVIVAETIMDLAYINSVQVVQYSDNTILVMYKKVGDNKLYYKKYNEVGVEIVASTSFDTFNYTPLKSFLNENEELITLYQVDATEAYVGCKDSSLVTITSPTSIGTGSAWIQDYSVLMSNGNLFIVFNNNNVYYYSIVTPAAVVVKEVSILEADGGAPGNCGVTTIGDTVLTVTRKKYGDGVNTINWKIFDEVGALEKTGQFTVSGVSLNYRLISLPTNKVELLFSSGGITYSSYFLNDSWTTLTTMPSVSMTEYWPHYPTVAYNGENLSVTNGSDVYLFSLLPGIESEIFKAESGLLLKNKKYSTPIYDSEHTFIFSSDGEDIGEAGDLIVQTIISGVETIHNLSRRNITEVNAATYALAPSDEVLMVTYPTTAAVTSLTIPPAQIVDGRTIIIKDASGNAGTNNITIDTGGSKTIDGEATLVINTDYASYTLTCYGGNLYIT